MVFEEIENDYGRKGTYVKKIRPDPAITQISIDALRLLGATALPGGTDGTPRLEDRPEFFDAHPNLDGKSPLIHR